MDPDTVFECEGLAVNRSRGTARVFEATTGREMTFPQRSTRGGLIELSDGSQLSTVVFANDQSTQETALGAWDDS